MLDRRFGTLNADFFDGVIGLTDACGIQQFQRNAVQFGGGFDYITGGACNVGDDRALAAAKQIGQRRFADVGTARNGDPDAVLHQTAGVIAAHQRRELFCGGRKFFYQFLSGDKGGVLLLGIVAPDRKLGSGKA